MIIPIDQSVPFHRPMIDSPTSEESSSVGGSTILDHPDGITSNATLECLEARRRRLDGGGGGGCRGSVGDADVDFGVNDNNDDDDDESAIAIVFAGSKTSIMR